MRLTSREMARRVGLCEWQMQDTVADRQITRDADPAASVAVSLAGRRLRLRAHPGIAGCAPLWDEIEREGARASVFQSFGWLSTWAATAAKSSGEQPLTVSVRDAAGRLVALFPLGIARIAGSPVAGFLGQSHANYGLPLVTPDLLTDLEPATVHLLLSAAGRLAGAAAVHLDRQPAVWNGRKNPFAATASFVSANDSHILALPGDFAAHFARLFSARTRQTLRRKARRLGDLGGYRLGPATTGSTRTALLEAFMAAKSRQFREAGIPDLFRDKDLVDFYRALLALPADSPPRLEIVALQAGGDTGAVALMATDKERRYFLNTALCAESLRDSSPGLLLLTHDIETATAAGASEYDFGPGAAAYKSAWRPAPIPLMTTLFAISALGVPAVLRMRAEATVRRTIKRTPLLWSLVQSFRRGVLASRVDRRTRHGP